MCWWCWQQDVAATQRESLIERALDGIESAAFLSEAQKRDILYNNAARYLRLTEAQIATHHGR